MKNTTLLKFLGFPSYENYVVSRGENGFKLDFSKSKTLEEGHSKIESRSKNKSLISIVMLVILFLFSNLTTAQIILDGDPSDWGTLLSSPGGIKARITDPTDGTDDIWTLGSKDIQPISQWAWTTNSANDKNNMANVGYYFDGTKLYFFADRRANNGDSAIGFWILQDSVGKLGVTSGGFSGQHVEGDVLMISHFVNGGSVAEIQAFRWTNGALDPTPIPLPTTGLDARVNVTTVPAPAWWNYTPKFGAPNTYPSESFFEGFIDLSSINFNLSVCLGTFLAETRQSQSLTASLEDLARGRFGSVPLPKTLVGSSFCSSVPNSGTITMANSEAQVSYQLKNNADNSNVQIAQLGDGETITWSNLPAGSYYVVATNILSECTIEIGRPTLVNVVQAPTVTVNSPSKCANDPAVTITATVNPAGTYNYNWTVPMGAINPGNVASFSATVGGTYSVVVTSTQTNCSNSGSGTLTVNPNPTLVTNNPAPVCAPLTVDLTAAAVTAGSNLQGGSLSYWTNAEATTPLNNPAAVNTSGTYYIKVTTSANCTDIKPVTVTVIPIIPIVINCPQNINTSACAYADQAAVNAAFQNWLAGFTASGGNGILATSGLQNHTAPSLCQGGTVTVNFNASDDCGKQVNCSATFTITAPAAVTTNAPANASASACAYADQAAVNAAFDAFLNGFSVSGGCDPNGSFAGQPVAPSLCEGGTTTVTYNVSDKCYTGSVSRTFTITVAPALVLNSPDSALINSCDYPDQAAVDAAFAVWLSQFSVSGGCNPVGDYGSPAAPPLCSGGTTTVTYTVTDKCTSPTVTETFTVIPAAKLQINCPADRMAECGKNVALEFEAWKNSFSYSGGCDNAVATDLSQLQAPEPGQSITVTFTVTDNCQTVSCTARFSVDTCGEGCTLGYWKSHTDRWCPSYRTCDLFGAVFTNAPSSLANLTLLQALNLGGGGINNLARQGVAALLNACSDEVDYAGFQDVTQDVIDAVNQAFATGGNAPGFLASQLDEFNNIGCPLGGTRATSSSNCTTPSAPSLTAAFQRISVKVYPNPTNKNFNVDLATISEDKISVAVYDMLGRLVDTVDVDPKNTLLVQIGDQYPSGVYNVVVTQGEEVKTLRVIKR
ncbi:T9SS type A sorting domain-containing protein [Flavobacterium sp.]|uniref:T9SS type A sorting domain-containing protein n=1 Tax=Flavobacterium sp. TaxID=239 RepID=UPI0025FFD17C|nr:T9SS type A sorting domain-containing protein [Flavobacterium sp.]